MVHAEALSKQDFNGLDRQTTEMEAVDAAADEEKALELNLDFGAETSRYRDTPS